jgi:hypothetical protein
LLPIFVVVGGVIGFIVIVVLKTGVDAGGIGVVALGNSVVALGNGVVGPGNGVVALGNGVSVRNGVPLTREMLIEEGRDFLAFGSYIFPGAVFRGCSNFDVGAAVSQYSHLLHLSTLVP